RAAGDAHAVSQFSYSLHNAIFAHGTIMLAIDDYFFSVFVFGLQESVKQELDGLKRLAITADETPAFLGVNLKGRIATFVGDFLDLQSEGEITKYRIETILRSYPRF